MHINQFFDYIYCINLNRRTDRWQAVQKELSKHGIKATRFEALDGYELSFKHIPTVSMEKKKFYFPGDDQINTREAGLIFSHKMILLDAIAHGYNNILILEDDIVFKDNFAQMFDTAVKELPSDWDMFYLGGMNWFGNDKPYSDNLRIANKTLGTYAVGINHTVFEKLLDLSNLKEHIDITYAKLLRDMNSYIANPHLVGQTIGYSDIKSEENIEDPFSFENRIASEEINIWGKYPVLEQN